MQGCVFGIAEPDLREYMLQIGAKYRLLEVYEEQIKAIEAVIAKIYEAEHLATAN